jgi:8-amino-7-oxononanoate synthase
MDFPAKELESITAQGRLRRMRTFQGPPGPVVRLEGRDVLMFGSNDYLGLSTHPEVLAAAQQAIAQWGTGSGGSRLLSGNTDLHLELEAALARLKGTEDAVLFASGYQANVGAVTALCTRGDAIASDRLNHASLIDAARQSRADVHVYEHANAQAARTALQGATRARRRLLVTDGVFSMDGDEAPLRELVQAARETDSLLMVDDAHGTGVLAGGRGTAAAHGADVDVHMGTLSKALASQGGFIAGTAEFCQWLRNVSRPFIFSTAPAPASMAAALAALRVMEREPARVERLQANAARLRKGLRALGLRVPEGRAAILPIVVGSEEAAMATMHGLEESGVYAGAVRPPTVPPGSCRIRVTVMATHTEQHLDACVEAMRAVAEVSPWASS